MLLTQTARMTASYGAERGGFLFKKQERFLWLEELFFLDGQDMIQSLQHGLFTGLDRKYTESAVN